MKVLNSEKPLLITIDQSTASTKGFLFDTDGKILGEYSLPHKQYYPKPGWVEHDPTEIFNNTLKVIEFLAKKAESLSRDIIGITITNQRETVVAWDRKTGKPLYNAIVWQCMRGMEICESLKKRGYEEMVMEKTGLVIDPYFSASKIKWLLRNLENTGIPTNRVALGTIDSWLIWKLTEGDMHATDFSNACRTMLFNIKKLRWDDELLELFDVPESSLPTVLPSNAVFGYTKCSGVLNKEVPISGVMGDSQAALFGQGCFEKGMVKATYGTGSSIMMNIGERFLMPFRGIVTSIGWRINNEITYVFEGNVHATGAAIKWLMDNLGIIEDLSEVENICSSIEDTDGVYFVPAFSGLGSPYWENRARGLIYGLTFKSNKAHIIRAAVESIAYQIRDVLEVFKNLPRVKINELRVDGGGAKNNFLMQFQADILGIRVLRARIEDMSAFGSYLMGGLGFKLWKNRELLSVINSIPRDIFYPKLPEARREEKYEVWKRIVRKALPP